jgi:hypothetical protein
MKKGAFLLLLILVGCSSTDPTAGITDKTYVDISAFHKPIAINGQTFVVVSGNEPPSSLEFETYANVLANALRAKGLAQATSDQISATNFDFVIFLRYKDLSNGTFNSPYGPLLLRRCSVNVDVTDERTLALVSQLTTEQANALDTSLCQATIKVSSYGQFDDTIDIPLALQTFAEQFPFTNSAAFHKELVKYLPKQ